MVTSLGLQADVGAGQADLGEAGAERRLAGDEGRAAGGAALLGVVVGEDRALVADPVDVGRAVAHQALGVDRQVRLADVVAEDDEDVRFRRRLLREGERARRNGEREAQAEYLHHLALHCRSRCQPHRRQGDSPGTACEAGMAARSTRQPVPAGRDRIWPAPAPQALGGPGRASARDRLRGRRHLRAALASAPSRG